MSIAAAYPNVVQAICLWREARNQSHEAKRGVLWVIKNRASDTQKRWPREPLHVVLQPRQFSSFNAGDVNAAKFPDAEDAAWLDCCSVVDDPGADPTKGANHYHSLPSSSSWPQWAHDGIFTVSIGAFRFYKL